MTKIKVNSDIEDTLYRAFNMSSIAVTLIEKALKVYEHYGDAAYHERRRKNPSKAHCSFRSTRRTLRSERRGNCSRLRMTMRPRKP
jgi:hypothetical protein